MIQNKETAYRRRQPTDAFDSVNLAPQQENKVKLLPVKVVRAVCEADESDAGGTRFVSLSDFYLAEVLHNR